MPNRFVPLLLAALALAAPAPALAQNAITSFDANTLSGAINAVGGKPGEARVEDGKTFYVLTLPNRLPAIAYFDDCEGQTCKALVVLCSLAIPQGRTAAQVDEMLRQVNNSVPSAKVFRMNDRVVAQHYVLADFGIAPANLQEHLRVFSNVTGSMFQALNPQPEAGN